MNQKEFDFRLGCMKSMIYTYKNGEEYCWTQYNETRIMEWKTKAKIDRAKADIIRSCIRMLTNELSPELKKEFES